MSPAGTKTILAYRRIELGDLTLNLASRRGCVHQSLQKTKPGDMNECMLVSYTHQRGRKLKKGGGISSREFQHLSYSAAATPACS